jgi:osmotically inducible protein OsmC
MITSSSEAIWEGGLKGGNGTYSAGSGSFKGSYSFDTRFEGAKGSTPEELLAAAHAACFSMALAAGLEVAGTPATRVTTKASATVEKANGGFRITTIKLETRGVVPGIDQAKFQEAAKEAAQGCPVSQALANNLKVELEATLESGAAE